MADTTQHLILGGAHSTADGTVPDTASAFWLSEFATLSDADNTAYVAFGQTGDLQDLSIAETPNWAVGADIADWMGLEAGGTDAVWVHPETTIQFAAPSVAYAGQLTSPLDDVLALIDAVEAAAPGTPIVIYEDWADPAPFLINGQLADLAQVLMPDNPEDGAAARALLAGAVGFSDTFDTALPDAAAVVKQAAPGLEPFYPDVTAEITKTFADIPTVTDPDDPDVTDPSIILGTEAADTVTLGPKTETVDLGAGLDTVVLAATRLETTITFAEDGSLVTETLDGPVVTVQNVERLAFEDGTLAFDTDGIAGQAYRLYQATFDRTPDAEGLGFWIDELDSGEVSLLEAADFFMQSEEFAAAYGTPDEVTDVLFLTLLYVNALDRMPDDEGFIYWRDQQEQGVTRAEMMVYFSESVENVAQVAPDVADGIWFL